MLNSDEIKKALECCKGNWDCANCPYNDKCSSMHKDAFDYINHLEAKVEFYEKNRDKYQDDVMYLSKQCDELQVENERLKEELKITRAYLHDSGLEWDLLSYAEREQLVGE